MSAPTRGTATADTAPPLVVVERGRPDDREVAALLVALASLSGSAPRPAEDAIGPWRGWSAPSPRSGPRSVTGWAAGRRPKPTRGAGR